MRTERSTRTSTRTHRNLEALQPLRSICHRAATRMSTRARVMSAEREDLAHRATRCAANTSIEQGPTASNTTQIRHDLGPGSPATVPEDRPNSLPLPRLPPTPTHAGRSRRATTPRFPHERGVVLLISALEESRSHRGEQRNTPSSRPCGPAPAAQRSPAAHDRVPR